MALAHVQMERARQIVNCCLSESHATKAEDLILLHALNDGAGPRGDSLSGTFWRWVRLMG